MGYIDRSNVCTRIFGGNMSSYTEEFNKRQAEQFERFMHHLAFSSFDIEDIPWNKGDLDTKKFVELIDKHKKIVEQLQGRYKLLTAELRMIEKDHPKWDTHIIEYRIEELEKVLGLR